MLKSTKYQKYNILTDNRGTNCTLNENRTEKSYSCTGATGKGDTDGKEIRSI